MRALHRSSTSRGLLALWVVLIAALSPLWMGPALTPVLAAVAEAHHVCACGMAVGTCGCPECERAEHQRLSDKAPRPYPVLKGECERGQAVLSSVAVPPSVLPASLSVCPAMTATILEAPRKGVLISLERTGPPTPPPRDLFLAA